MPGGTLGDAVPQTPWDLSLSCQARSDAVDEENCGMTVTIPLGSGIGTKAKNPGGLGAEPPGMLLPDEPKKYSSGNQSRLNV